MLKDVGMTVPKSRETSAVYATQGMRTVYLYAARQEDEGMQYICSKTGLYGRVKAIPT